MERRTREIELAIEVIVRGHSAGRSRTFPYEVSRAESAFSEFSVVVGRPLLPIYGTSQPHILDGSQVARIGNAMRITRRRRSVTMNGSTP